MTTVEVLSRLEYNRQCSTLNLIASENYPSQAVREALGSVFTYKYAEGYPSHRYYGGCVYVDELEEYTKNLACKAFNATYANVQPHSGAQANMAVYQALLKPGDTVLSLGLKDGGHLTHGSPANASGKLYNFIHYPVDGDELDYEDIERLAEEHVPKLIVGGGSSTIARIDWERLCDICAQVNAYLMADVAHTAGFIVAKMLDNPIRKYADVMTMTTQKTLRGPRGGLILTHYSKIAEAVNKAVFPGTQGGPHMNTIAAKAVALEEANTRDFCDYMEMVSETAEKFASYMSQLIGPENVMYNPEAMPHMVLINTNKAYSLTGAEAQDLLQANTIIVNKQALPDDTCSPAVGGGIRVGFPAAITRHMRSNIEKPFPVEHIAKLIDCILTTKTTAEGEYSLSKYLMETQKGLGNFGVHSCKCKLK